MWQFPEEIRYGLICSNNQEVIKLQYVTPVSLTVHLLRGLRNVAISSRKVKMSVSAYRSKHYLQMYKLRGLSPRTNYTHRAAVICRRSNGSLRPYYRFSRPEQLLFHSSSSSVVFSRLSDPVPDPLVLRKSGSVGNRTRTSGPVARKSDH
jgi:hypothetical protein